LWWCWHAFESDEAAVSHSCYAFPFDQVIEAHQQLRDSFDEFVEQG